MADTAQSKDQQHPLWSRDRQIVDSLKAGEPSDYNLAELARLKIRYDGFPGAHDIRTDLDAVMTRWGYTEERLFETTRQLHQTSHIYDLRANKREDWS